MQSLPYPLHAFVLQLHYSDVRHTMARRSDMQPFRPFSTLGRTLRPERSDAQNWLDRLSRFFSDEFGCDERIRNRELEDWVERLRRHASLGARRTGRHFAGI